MSITLSNQNSKFAHALSTMLAPEVSAKTDFIKAIISDDGSTWELHFCVSRSFDDNDRKLLEEALKKIIPQNVTFALELTVAPPELQDIPSAHGDTVAEQNTAEYDADTAPDDCPPPPEDCPIPDDSVMYPDIHADDTMPEAESVANDFAESAMDRYRRRMEALSREAAQSAQSARETRKPEKKKASKDSVSKDGIALFGKDFIIKDVAAIKDLDEFSGFVTVCGDIISCETRELKSGKTLFSYAFTDYTSSLTFKIFAEPSQVQEITENISGHIAIQGRCMTDDFTNELTIKPNNIKSVKKAKKTDDAPIKRVEMHLHTKMSQMDGVVDAGKLVKLMMQYGHDTVAITDHGVVQAYPDMEDAIKKYKADIHIVFGVEGYLLDDDPVIMGIAPETKLADIKYCIYAIRTTGVSALTAKIIEIGACIVENGILSQNTFHSYINPHENVRTDILNEADIRQSALDSAPDSDTVIKKFIEYASGCTLLAHSADTSMPFLHAAFVAAGEEPEFPSIDTLRISRETVPNIKSGKFNKVCDALEIRTGDITDALKEAEITAAVWRKLTEILGERDISTVGELNKAMSVDNGNSYHIIMYAKDKKGLFNLYSLVTESHLEHLRRKRPQMPRSSIIEHREGLIIGSACEAGELYRAMLRGVSDEKLEEIASFYDCLEIQPLGNNDFLIREGIVRDKEHLIELNKKVIALGEKLGKPVLATGDVHYLLPDDAIYRSVIQCAEGFDEANIQAPLYYRTTEEMLDEFYYLDKEKREEIVIRNPRMIAEMCESMESFPRDHLYTPEMDNAEEDLRSMCEKKAHDMYGDELPEIVAARLEKELTAIIKHGYAVLYLIAHKVVKKSLSDGYLVGSRGSVGSSFAATMADITEVNPLRPHYLCPKCKYSDFTPDMNKYDCGVDMPKENCPNCGTEMLRLGFNIPFEVFMGFDGDKVPDIDLNFSGVYQPVVHKYIEELFGEKYVFRAGTIGGVADKTAIGYAKKYCEEYGLGKQRSAELTRMASGCIDVKRTTGQHAGGVVILPKKYNINEFTPLQYPANDPSQGIITTHFTFKSLHDTLLKADILGHDDPTVIRMLEDLTGIDVKKEVPLDDPKVMSIFLSPEALGVTEEEIGCKTGTFGIPEFGTGFTIQMLVDTKPKKFADLIKISGLSHGTDVWLGNAKDLIDNGTATISQCICTREDIMNGLLLKGVSDFPAFDTMEKVRKGKGIPEKYLEEIRAHDVPEWFIDSCNKIKYMFPKAHAAAYVTMAIRIAWFKVYKPHQYYATYFTVRADDFEIGIAQKTIPELRRTINQMHDQPNLNPREKGILIMLEMVLEMKCRKVEFTDIDIYKSDAVNFTVTEDNMIRPPLNAIPNLGENAAYSIVEARNEEMFKSQDDLLARTKLSNTLLGALEQCGCLRNLPKSQQISLFDF